LRGDEISFKLVMPNRQLAAFTGRVSAGRISGTVSTPSGHLPIEGRRR
jgi:hypothetical protein